MAVAFETVNVIMTEEQTEHINVQHVDHHQHMKSSKFFLSLNLKATLGLLSRITWEEREDVTAGSRMKTGSWILLSILI